MMFAKLSYRDKSRVFLCGVAVMFCLVGAGVRAKAKSVMLPVDQKVIVLDAGHGGWDPGKTGEQGADEKVLNLLVMEKLQQYLEQGGATVFVTRATDEALGESKNADMKERKVIANESNGDILVSIHQNAFPSASVSGAQVFYHSNSEAGKNLAECIQGELVAFVDNNNKRLAKANADYYMLRITEIPAVIVECGFLSNREEEQLLNDDAYQNKLAWAIYKGIITYFSDESMA